ncbi:hypothetical protein F5H01DRAFT_60151 [Linnemannia elongata]|nr:hypothetical protein F5H01DRAFT_60151 [Linnemannia elongata]
MCKRFLCSLFCITVGFLGDDLTFTTLWLFFSLSFPTRQEIVSVGGQFYAFHWLDACSLVTQTKVSKRQIRSIEKKNDIL